MRPHGCEVIVVDDSSSDDTFAIARGFDGVSAFPAGLTPEGWLGKSWACHVGAVAASSETLLFLDADVRLEPGAIEALLHELSLRGGLVSVEPYHHVERPYEEGSALFGVVSFMGIAAGRDGHTEGAFGPVMATNRADYELVGGHRSVRGEVVEDMALARRYSDHDRSVTVLTGGHDLRFRMYPSGFTSLVEGWTKNFATGAGSTPVRRLAGIVIWLTAMGSAFTTLLGSFDSLPALAISAALCVAFALQLRSMFARLGNFSVLAAALFPLQLALFFAVFFRSLWFTVVRRKVRWRGREVPIGAAAVRSSEVDALISLDDTPALLAVAILAACWLVIGLGTGLVGHRLPLRCLDHDTWITRARKFERGGRFYESLRIRSWKDRLPEGGATFRDGVSKAHLIGRSDADLERFAAETRRAEYVHWANAAAGPLFAVFLPVWIVVVMTAFGLAVHLPFVAIQRYNRARLQRTLARRRLRDAGVDLTSRNAKGHRLPA